MDGALALTVCRFHCLALDSLAPGPAGAGNTLRGALGFLLPQPVFRPRREAGLPSGLKDPPRPFVLRADFGALAAGAQFEFAVHCFAHREAICAALRAALAGGVGRTGGRVRLLRVESQDVRLDLSPRAAAPPRLRVQFTTPTDLKNAAPGAPPFATLLARVRDRISALATCYGGAPLAADFRGLVERAAGVTLLADAMRPCARVRRSTHTGQSHDVGGWVGEAVYGGDFRESLAWLESAWWTGVGRHAVWGNGAVRALPG